VRLEKEGAVIERNQKGREIGSEMKRKEGGDEAEAAEEPIFSNNE